MTLSPLTLTPPQRQRLQRRVVFVLGVLAAIALGLFVARNIFGSFRPHLYAGTVLQTDSPAPSLSELSYANGDPVDLGAYNGQVVLLYFGFTNCPDICPTTLATAASAVRRLDDPDVPLLMVTVDPERDDPSSLQAYVEYFAPTFRGVTGETAEIDQAASSYGVFYELGEDSGTGEYTVDHTASLMGIGPDGVLRIIWAADVSADSLADDIEELRS